MSKVQILKGFTIHLLTTAAEEVFEQFERTIAEYEEQLWLLKEENERQKKLLDTVLSPQLCLHRADIQQLLKNKDLLPMKYKRSPNPDQENSPEPPQKKEKQEEKEQLQGPQEEEESTADPLKVIIMKSEDRDEYEEMLSSSQLHQKQTDQMETGSDEEDCGEPESSKNPGPETSSDQVTEDCSETGTDDIGTQGQRREPQSGLEVRGTENRKTQTDEKPHPCTKCWMVFQKKSSLEKHLRAHMEIEPFFCSMCDKIFRDESDLRAHIVQHSAEKLYSCSACYGKFTWLKELEDHGCVSRPSGASSQHSSGDHHEETQEHHSGSPGSHQVFTDLDSFLSCTAEGCVFCRTEQVASEKHLRNKHLKEAIYFLDETTEKFAVACFCKDTSDSKRSHYHCPFCEYRTLGREFNFKCHMQKIHGIAAGKIKGLKVYDVQKTKAEQEEKVSGSPEENERQQERLEADLDPQLWSLRPGSHRVFTNLDSFLSCTAEECLFCRTEQVASEKHLRNKHLKEAIYFLEETTEMFVVACFCKDTPHSKRSHYHCPFCEYRTLVREFNFKYHMRKIHGIAAGKIKDREWAQRLRESDTNNSQYIPVLVKSEDDEEKPQFSQFYQRQTEEIETGADEEDCGGPDPETEVNSEDSSEPETDDSDDWREPTEHKSGLNSKSVKKSIRCNECRKTFETKKYLALHTRVHFGEKPFSCSECKKGFLWKGNLKQHMQIHKEGNPSAALSAAKDVM